MMSGLFNVMREKMGTIYLNSLVEDKVFAISGDISKKNMGIKNSKLREHMFKEIDIIINSAATTNFDERYICKIVNIFSSLFI